MEPSEYIDINYKRCVAFERYGLLFHPNFHFKRITQSHIVCTLPLTHTHTPNTKPNSCEKCADRKGNKRNVGV